MSQRELIPPQGDMLRSAKEIFAALIAVGIIVGFFVMLVLAFQHVGMDENSFTRIKDLLLFVNPLVGVVVGYYFNRISTEARAETAETAARATAATAQNALAQRAEAESQAHAAQEEAREVRGVLSELVPAAEQVLEQVDPPQADDDDAAGDAVADDNPRARLRAALQRARRAAV